jgi:hypothetical protein
MPLLFCALGFAAPPGHAEIYKYVDENGRVTFTDTPRQGQRAADVYRYQTDAPAARPASTAQNKVSGEARVANPGPTNFPRVDAGTQRKRDDVRLGILREELQAEQASLAAARSRLAGEKPQSGERNGSPAYMARLEKWRAMAKTHENNLLAIEKEIRHLR